MKRSDMGLVACIYAVILFFFVMTLKLKPEAQIYPMVVMALLFLLNTGFLVQQCLIARREGRKPVNDLASLFEGFQPGQFAAVLVLSVLYVALIGVLGFYAATAAYLVVTLLCLRVRTLYILITVLAFAGLVYCAFTLFLHVPLPAGFLR
ncbi:MAG: tripartite tricarboxylate transporter TctB family protein [Clostridium sp.]|nr:tripartite tricarboxylate transporter TctB family protein [Clostridium sp.]